MDFLFCGRVTKKPVAPSAYFFYFESRDSSDGTRLIATWPQTNDISQTSESGSFLNDDVLDATQIGHGLGYNVT